MDTKPLRIRFNKIDGFIKNYDGIRYLVLRDYERYNSIYDRIKYLMSEKSSIINSINHNFVRIEIDSYNSLPIETMLTFHVIMLIKSVVNKNKNDYYYNIFLEKGSYKESDTRYFLMNT